ncbi:MarR family winged helix-turn-helix transcriptional regulator [Ruegeria sp. Ofav3-42]|uniref:MarR family winged helix-turn-helix transcriptional regulator n=1 Tax=Ruegeria sp. Ofav3-42 TaxID=2917759 RepID=UPI001EF45F3D|nr:MarR family transcriptional regulator [Ruegeria sp. Ofav3-42]MCG7521990.1 MarR family transcriptional regulator [Ruegeria sp. Ofav3-42]
MSDKDELARRRLRAWIRLLRATRATENHLREFLRTQHDTTLPRFDVAAALYRHNKPMKMSELGKLLLVSNGNVTAIVERMESDGLAKRWQSPDDRRSVLVALTDSGRNKFEDMARAHEAEVNALFSGLDDSDLDMVRDLLHKVERDH